MRYLHGDSTPFPVNQNFLETLGAATDACVELFEAELAAEKLKQVTYASDASVQEETARVDRLARAVTQAIGPFAPADSPSRAAEALAIRIGQLVRGAIEESKADIAAWREETIAAAAPGTRTSLAALGDFLVIHDLPETSWTFEWSAPMKGRVCSVRLDSRTPLGLHGVYTCELVTDHLWARPVRVDVVAKGAWVPIMKRSWLGKAKWKQERLDDYWITGARRTEDCVALTVGKSRREISEGFDLVIRTGEPEGCYAQPLDKKGKPVGERISMEGDARRGLLRLWHNAEGTLVDLVRCRHKLVGATIKGQSIEKVEKPSRVAEAIIDALAPIVREMHRHSRTRGELALKRDLGDGRREEMFVAHDEIRRRYEHLPMAYQSKFDPFDLEDGSTAVYSAEDVGLAPRVEREPMSSEAGA